MAAAAFLGANVSLAAEFTIKTIDKAPPKEIGESIRAVLKPQAIQLLEDEKPALEIWLRQEVPLKSKPAASNGGLDSVPEATLMAACVVDGTALRDYKDNEIPKGTYTARFILQPQDGDHLGTAEFNYFVALVAADTDKELEGIKQFKPLVKASGKLTSSGHPLIVSLRPASDATAAALTEPAAEHRGIRLKMRGKSGAGESGDLTFDLIFQGHGHIQ